ncbi:MAG: hypothetical protein U1A72_14990 [Sulfuritalea sp.]|nr:hypothetical protein [Sulfuritalea sp.]
MTFIVAVAAPIGGGKTALVKGLAQALNAASTLHFDHYELATRKTPEELARWLAAGADFNELSAPGLLSALQALKRGEPVTNPASGQAILPGDYLILEMPLGRAYAATAELIDVVIRLDIPLDVALARKLRELTAQALADDHEDPGGFLRWLDAYLDQYTEQVRAILQLQQQRVAAGADIVLDGLRPPHTLIAEARRALDGIRALRGRG